MLGWEGSLGDRDITHILASELRQQRQRAEAAEAAHLAGVEATKGAALIATAAATELRKLLEHNRHQQNCGCNTWGGATQQQRWRGDHGQRNQRSSQPAPVTALAPPGKEWKEGSWRRWWCWWCWWCAASLTERHFLDTRQKATAAEARA